MNTQAITPDPIQADPGQTVLVTGGIGDWAVYHSFYDFSQVGKILWACKAGPYLEPLIRHIHPHIAHEYPIGDETYKVCGAFHGKQHLIQRHQECKLEPPDLTGVFDMGVIMFFPRIVPEKYPFLGCPFLKHAMAAIDHLDLPERYAVVHPYTAWNRRGHRSVRDFSRHDWIETGKWLRRRGLEGVVLNTGDDPVPEGFLDLSNKTNLAESIEVLKHAKGYCGIDSCLSVLACQLFGPHSLMIRSQNSFHSHNRHLYCAPHLRWRHDRCSFVRDLITG